MSSDLICPKLNAKVILQYEHLDLPLDLYTLLS